jgi:hypothetical protein
MGLEPCTKRRLHQKARVAAFNLGINTAYESPQGCNLRREVSGGFSRESAPDHSGSSQRQGADHRESRPRHASHASRISARKAHCVERSFRRTGKLSRADLHRIRQKNKNLPQSFHQVEVSEGAMKTVYIGFAVRCDQYRSDGGHTGGIKRSNLFPDSFFC